MLTRIVVLVSCGLALGAVMSLWLSQFVAALLFDLDARDPLMLAGAVLAMAALAALASGVPALRASFIDPADVLRRS